MPFRIRDVTAPDAEPALQPLVARAHRARLAAYAFAAVATALLFGWPVGEHYVGETAQLIGDLVLPCFLITGALLVAVNSRRSHVAVEHERAVIAEERGRRDELSGLYTVRHLRESMHAAIAEAARDGVTPLALIALDLDNFKDVNDRFGHVAGDAMLGAIGAAIGGTVGSRGIAARPAGDEFAVLLPGAGRQTAEQFAELLTRAIGHASVTSGVDNAYVAVSASYGIAVYPRDGADAEALTAAASRALHRTKGDRLGVRERSGERDSEQVFFAIGEAVGRSLDPQEVVGNFCRAVGSSLRVDMCGVWRIGDDDVISMLTSHLASGEPADASGKMARLNPITLGEAEACGLIGPDPVYLDDASASMAMPERFRVFMPPGTWMICAPVSAASRGILVLSADHARCAPPDMGLVRAIAQMAAAALANSQAYEGAQRRAEQLAGLAGVGGLLLGTGQYEDRLGAVARSIVEVTGYDTVTIDTSDPSGALPFYRNFYGRSPDGAALDEEASLLWRSMRPALNEPAIVDFLREANRPIVMNDPLSQVPEIYREVIDSAGIRTVAVVPILWQDELLGMLYFSSYRREAFGAGDVALMHSIASQLAPAIQVVSLHLALETSYRDLKDAHLEALLRLAYAAEARDPYTECHLQRIRATAQAIAQRMGIDGDELEALGYGAVVHDLGKLRIPDSILMNPGSLSDDEWTQMKRHPEWGAEIIGENAFYDVARQVALCHHERWDGSGYPRGLAGEAIPLAARIVAVADVYDALTTARPYKAEWPPERALVELMRLRERTLCPRSVDTFMDLWREGEIARIDAATAEDSMELDFRNFRAA